MIVLDTNVVSELMRATPDEAVVAWLDRQQGEPITITAMTMGELLYGVLRLPEGRRRTMVGTTLLAVLAEELTPGALPFDAVSAEHFAEIAADRAASGRPIDTADAVIAATCRANDARLATRNGRDFDGTGVTVVDPWTAP